VDWNLIADSSWFSWWLDPWHWLAMLKVALGLGFVVFVHELGHFLVAKACGVKCEKFYIGFDIVDIKIGKWVIIPKSLFKFKYGETEYGLGILPLGGYVKMLGQDDNPRNMEAENERSRIRKESGEEGKEEAVEIDPRSYLAKKVWQRMAIISAGVIMNLIFAVIFATIAHWIGVPYQPCLVGDTVPGSAAWKAGLRPGDKVIQINGGRVSERLRWDWDMMNATFVAGVKGEVTLGIKSASGTERVVNLRPRTNRVFGNERPVLGIQPERTTQLNEEPVLKRSVAGNANVPFKGNDEVIALRTASQSTPTPVSNYEEIETIAAQHGDEPLWFTVKRPAAKPGGTASQLEIEVPTMPRRTLGVVMRRGAISGVRPGSPAEAAGLKEGDIIRDFAGQRFGDPLTFPDRLAPYYGQTISLGIDRPDENGKTQRLSLKISPEAPLRFFGDYSEDSDYSVESLGIVYPVYQIVQEVSPGSPAAKAGLRPGDVITQFQVVPHADHKTEEEKHLYVLIKKAYKLGPDLMSWPFVDWLVQRIFPDSQVRIIYRRPPEGADFAEVLKLAKDNKSESREALVQPIDSEYFYPERGWQFDAVEEPARPAGSLGEAFSLGLRQTYEDATKILMILRRVVTGKLSPTNFGGIGSIALVATKEASQGTPRLLLFLTFLSANLAVVNFLPIPVLDGGHMMFLAFEGIFRRPVPEKWQFALTVAGLVFVLTLFLFTNGLDVYRFIIEPLMRWLG
jgi:regulator of sigma E protease